MTWHLLLFRAPLLSNSRQLVLDFGKSHQRERTEELQLDEDWVLVLGGDSDPGKDFPEKN